MTSTQKSHSAIVIGGGSTGAAVAHDLALRGFEVTLVERGEIASGTTGRNHCLLHSGGRYCVNDREAGIECIEENMILRRIMPDCMELNGGLFAAFDDADMDYLPLLIEGCQACEIPYKKLTGEEARRLEPYLSPQAKAALWVPDGVFEPMRMCMAFLATAKANGAKVYPFTQVEELLMEGTQVTGVRVWNRIANRRYNLHAQIVISAGGPWAEEIAAMAGIDVPVIVAPGVMVSMTGRYSQHVINRCNKADDGDIIVPQRETSIIGTSSWTVDDPDYIDIPEDHVALMLDRGSQMIPALKQASSRGVFTVARPLIGREGEDEREVSRTFECFDHDEDGIGGFVTISGGKTTTARAMAEKTVDIACRKIGLDVPCRTHETVLLSYRAFYTI
ncbi:MAG: FAD-dependent oxidoreductase [Anaerolineae bacterium]|nr:FAD-dependent oxidoreductase [Anaerolineae bacterium]